MGAKTSSPKLHEYCRRHERSAPCLYCSYDDELRAQHARAEVLWGRLKIIGLGMVAGMALVVTYC